MNIPSLADKKRDDTTSYDQRQTALQIENDALRRRVDELERQLAACEAREEILTAPYYALFDALPVPVVLYRRDGMAIAINRQNEQLIGVKRESIVGRHNIFADPQAVEMGYLASFERALLGEIVKMPPTAYDTAKASLDDRIDDRQIWSETTYFPIHGRSGAITCIGEINLDVTERERAAAEEQRLGLDLQKRERRFRAMFDNAALGVAILDAEQRIIDSNAALLTMLGYTADELHGLHFAQITHPDDAEQDSILARELHSGQRASYQLEKRYLHKDGSVVVGRLTASLVRGPAGEFEFGIGMVEDITERLRIERKLMETQKLESLGLLAGGIAHDFNNLLVALLGNATLALEDLPDDSPARPSVEHIEVAARRAAELTHQILAYAGKGRFVVERLNLNDIVYDISHLLQTAIPKHVTLRVEPALSLPDIDGDPTQFRQVIMNLIVNAAEAIGSQSGTVTVTTGTGWVDMRDLADAYVAAEAPPGPYVMLAVEDTGAGMDAATRDKIFEPFFTTKFTGRGLGLAAVLGIVRAHKGAIKIDSAPGKGTRFTVLLPVTNASIEPTRAEPPPSAVAWRGSGTVLVIDDEEDVRVVAARLLDRLGFAALSAPDGMSGAELFRARASEISYVLLDMTMSHLSGYDTLPLLRQINAQVPIILMSGYDEQEAAGQFASKDTDLVGFLAKPFTVEDVRQLLQTFDAARAARPPETEELPPGCASSAAAGE